LKASIVTILRLTLQPQPMALIKLEDPTTKITLYPEEYSENN